MTIKNRLDNLEAAITPRPAETYVVVYEHEDTPPAYWLRGQEITEAEYKALCESGATIILVEYVDLPAGIMPPPANFGAEAEP